jgi:hypothetical protein
MTMQKNRPLIALPNVLRDQTVPNTLRGMRQESAPVRRPFLSLGMIAVAIAAAIAVLLIWIGRVS